MLQFLVAGSCGRHKERYRAVCCHQFFGWRLVAVAGTFVTVIGQPASWSVDRLIEHSIGRSIEHSMDGSTVLSWKDENDKERDDGTRKPGVHFQPPK